VKLSQVKRVKTFCLRSVTLGEKIQKEETKKNKIRLHPNIVLLTLALRTVRILTCVCSYPSR
jgi:hypothetical protein